LGGLVTLTNSGRLAFMVIEAIADELTEIAIPKTELDCFRIQVGIEETILICGLRHLSVV